MINYRDLLRIPVVIHKYTGANDMGDATFGATIESICYVEEETKVVVDKYGKEVSTHSTLYIAPNGTLTYDDELTLLGKTYRIKALNIVRDIDAVEALWVVYA